MSKEENIIEVLLKCCRKTEPLIQASAIGIGAYVAYGLFQRQTKSDKPFFTPIVAGASLALVGSSFINRFYDTMMHPAIWGASGAAIFFVFRKSVYIVSKFAIFSLNFCYKYLTEDAGTAMLYAEETLGITLNKIKNFGRGKLQVESEPTVTLTQKQFGEVLEKAHAKTSGEIDPKKIEEFAKQQGYQQKELIDLKEAMKNIDETTNKVYESIMKIIGKEEKDEPKNKPLLIQEGKNVFMINTDGTSQQITVTLEKEKDISEKKVGEVIAELIPNIKPQEITEQTLQHQKEAKQKWLEWIDKNSKIIAEKTGYEKNKVEKILNTHEGPEEPTSPRSPEITEFLINEKNKRINNILDIYIKLVNLIKHKYITRNGPIQIKVFHELQANFYRLIVTYLYRQRQFIGEKKYKKNLDIINEHTGSKKSYVVNYNEYYQMKYINIESLKTREPTSSYSDLLSEQTKDEIKNLYNESINFLNKEVKKTIIFLYCFLKSLEYKD